MGALVLGSAPPRESAILRMLNSASVKIVSIATKRAIPAVGAMAIMIVAVAFVGPQFRKALLPTFKDPNVLIRWQAPYGTSLPEMGRIMGRATAEIRTLPDVRAVGTQIGQAILGDQPVGSDSAEMWVSLKPNVDNSRAVRRLKRVVAGYPGIDHSVTTYSRERLRSVLGRTGDEVTVRIFGQDFGVLKKKANEVTKLIGGIKGIKNAKVATQQAEPTIQVEVDLAKAQKLGIKPGDVRRASATLLSGLRVGNLFQDQKIFDVTVWGEPNSRRSVTSVKDLLIDTPAGNVIRLGEVANVIVRSTAPIIEHQDVSRFIDIRANVGGDVGSARRHVRDRLKTIVFPYEYHGELLRDYADEQNSQRRIAGFAIGAAVAVFLLLQAASGSWRLAAIGFPTVVLPLSGGLIAARIYDRQMTFATVVGLLALLLLAIRTTVQYTDRYLQLRELGEPPGAESAALAARGQVQSTVATVLVTAIVFVPVLLYGSTAGQELLCPMAVVIEGGLLTLLLTAVIVLPGLTARFAPDVLTRPVHLDLARDTGHHTDQPIFTARTAAVAVSHTGEAQ